MKINLFLVFLLNLLFYHSACVLLKLPCAWELPPSHGRLSSSPSALLSLAPEVGYVCLSVFCCCTETLLSSSYLDSLSADDLIRPEHPLFPPSPPLPLSAVSHFTVPSLNSLTLISQWFLVLITASFFHIIPALILDDFNIHLHDSSTPMVLDYFNSSPLRYFNHSLALLSHRLFITFL